MIIVLFLGVAALMLCTVVTYKMSAWVENNPHLYSASIINTLRVVTVIFFVVDAYYILMLIAEILSYANNL